MLALPQGGKVNLEVLSNLEDADQDDLVRSTVARKLMRITVRKYLADKVQCIVERLEARDLVDIHAVVQNDPRLENTIKHLRAYTGADPKAAIRMRNLILGWLKDS